MRKSRVLHSKEDYIKWMFDCNFWTNKNYKPPEGDLPSLNQFPCIAVGELIQGYDGRWRPEIELVELAEFAGVTLYRVVELMDGVPPAGLGTFSSRMAAEYEKTNYEDDDEFKYEIREVTLDG